MLNFYKFFRTAKKGWNNKHANRYPMGKGFIPEYAYWDGEKLDYTQARKKIYFPLYANAVKKTVAYKKLLTIYLKEEHIYLWDFDGYDYINKGIALKEVIDHPELKMGHAFILAMLLEYHKKSNNI